MYSSSARDLPDFHRESKEIMTSINTQTEKIKTCRKKLLDSAKKAQDLKCISSLRSGYFLLINGDNAKEFSQLPFVQSENFSVAERLIELTKLGSLRTEITKFLAAIYKASDSLPEIFANLPTTSLKGSLPFLPEKTDQKQFLAFSTLPALFGHCWTSDLRYSYINFLIKTSEKLPSGTNVDDHWLMDCFTHFIHSSDIAQFLRASIGDTLMEIIRDDKFNSFSATSSKEYFDAMIPYMEKLLAKMDENMDIFPRDVRVLIRKFADLAPDDAHWLQRVESIFCKRVLAPAISLPKKYCVLPQTFNFKVSARSARALVTLASLFLYILHPSQASLRHQELDHEKLAKLPFEKFLRKLADVNCDALGGLKYTSLMPLLGIHNVFLVFSVPDICMLSHAVSLINPAIAKPLMLFAKKIPTDKEFPMIFFRHELWELQSVNLPKPEIRENELEHAKDTPQNAAAKSLFNFLQFSDELTGEPSGIKDFLAFHEERANLSNDDELKTYIMHLKYKISNVPENERGEIISALEDETRRQRSFASRNSNILTQIAIRLADIDALCVSSQAKADDLLPVLYDTLFDMFMKSDNSLQTTFTTNKANLLTCHATFIAFFEESFKKLKSFIEQLGTFEIDRISAAMHSWIMQNLTLQEYKEFHVLFTKSDEHFESLNQSVINSICVYTAPAKLRKMLADPDPELFVFAKNALNEAYRVEIPVEAMKKIADTFELLKKTYELSVGCYPSDNEFVLLVKYLILTSGIHDILSFSKYLEHFLLDVMVDKLIGKEKHEILKTFTNIVSTLDMELAL